MANEVLRQAMADAHVTQRDLAATCDVDEKTVQRWVSDDQRVPHPRHREAVAVALGVDDSVIWESVRRNLKTGYDREVVSVWPRRADVPRSLWRDLISTASHELWFAGYTSYFLWLELHNLPAVLARKATDGAQLRFILGDTDSPLTAARDAAEATPLTIGTRIAMTQAELARLSEVDVRYTDKHLGLSLYRFDDDMLVMQHLTNGLGHDSPTWHLHRDRDDGLFARYAAHLAWLRDSAHE